MGLCGDLCDRPVYSSEGLTKEGSNGRPANDYRGNRADNGRN